MYCKDYTHSLVAGEDDDAFWVQNNISMKYPAKISGSVDEILSETVSNIQQKVGRVLQRLKGRGFSFLEAHFIILFNLSSKPWQTGPNCVQRYR